MSKIKTKTKSAAKKRFKVTANGKIKFTGAYRRHLLAKKSKAAKRRMKCAHYLAGGDHAKVAKLLPYN